MSKVAIITGASRGIGRATALKLARDGYDLAVCCRDNKALADEVCSLAREYGVCAESFVFDVADSYECENAITQICESLGCPDVLVNNAGIALYKMIVDTTDDDFSRVMAVNVGGTFNMTRAVLVPMVKAKSGSIVNVSSMWGVIGGSCESVYSATKGAIIAFTKATAKEVGLSHIRVNCVAPGVIRTDMTANLSEDDLNALADETPLNKIGEPEDVADAISFLCSDNARFITGQVLNVDGGMVI